MDVRPGLKDVDFKTFTFYGFVVRTVGAMVKEVMKNAEASRL